MDGDGQNDPYDIPRLFEVLAAPGGAGPALVGGVRPERKATGSKRWASRAANWIRDKVLQDECPDTGCGIKVYWREVFLRLPFFTSMHRYLPALFQTLRPRGGLCPRQRPAAAGRRLQVQQPQSCPRGSPAFMRMVLATVSIDWLCSSRSTSSSVCSS